MKENIIKNLTEKDDKYACALSEKIISESKETDEWYEYFDDFVSLFRNMVSLESERMIGGEVMKKAMKILIIVLASIGVAAAFFRYNQEGFTGNRVKNSDSYLLDIERMNGTDLHTLDLQTGDVLRIQFETLKGSLYMEIKAPDGTAIYRGNGKETTDFTVKE